MKQKPGVAEVTLKQQDVLLKVEPRRVQVTTLLITETTATQQGLQPMDLLEKKPHVQAYAKLDEQLGRRF